MKTRRFIQSLTLAVLSAASLSQIANAQTPFSSGSNGSFGPLIVDGTTGHKTIALPPDGILHCTTVNIADARQLSFTRNATNTPAYILATGDVTISNGYIFVLGISNVGRRGGDGGPGAFAGGQGGSSPSNGFGPGGGKGGWNAPGGLPAGKSVRGGGGFATAGTPTGTGGSIYGNSLLIPLVGGSGGGGADGASANDQYGGGGGGGALLIASNTKITIGQNQSYYIDASGGNASSGYGGGSGGGVRLVAPIIEGTANIRIAGSHTGGFGRIRVDALTNALNFFDSDGSASYASFGANMVVFPSNLPELRVTQAAGQTIALTQTDPVFVLLPAGAPATQTVQVQVKNFNSVVPLVAVVTPEAGDRTTFNFDVDNTAGGATTGSVQVQIPAGVSTRIDVWTR